jgi:hypothetical protein
LRPTTLGLPHIEYMTVSGPFTGAPATRRCQQGSHAVLSVLAKNGMRHNDFPKLARRAYRRAVTT